MTKGIVLCADDYGQAPSISEAIFELAKQRRLSAISCLVNTIYWPVHAGWLVSFEGQIDIGLHFNLTEGKALATGEPLVPLQSLLKLAQRRKLDRAWIKAELNAQLDMFIDIMGFIPDFIDGHQHVHQFPVIRDVFIEVYKERFPNKKPYIRTISVHFSLSNIRHNFKSLIILLSGAHRFKKRLRQQALPHNLSFSGIYPFDDKTPYRQWFQSFLKQVKAHGLIMCHPGFSTTDNLDSIHKARQAEFDYLISDQFIQDCQKHNVVLCRFSV